MRLALGQLLQNVDKVDGREEVAPRVVGHELDLDAFSGQRPRRRVVRPARMRRRGRTLAKRRLRQEGIFGSLRSARMKVIAAELEEAERGR